MAIFFTTLNQMLLLFTFLGIGFFFQKRDLFPQEAKKILARLENFLFMPALILNTFRSNCTPENLISHWDYLFWGIVLILLSVPIAYFLAKRLSSEDAPIYRYSFVISNFAFMGNSLVRGIYGEETLFLYMIYTLPMTFFAYSIGVAWLRMSKDAKLSFRAFLNPVFFSVVLGIILGLTRISLPDFVESAITSSANCMTPVAMILTGMVIGSYSIKTLIYRPVLYLTSFIRLIILPVLGVLFLRLFDVNQGIQMAALCSLSMPLGLNTIIIPSAYGKDTTLGAGMALVSHSFSLITIPLLFLLFSQSI